LFELYRDHYQFSKFSGPYGGLIIDTKSIGYGGSDVFLSVMKKPLSHSIFKLSVLDLESRLIEVIDFPASVLTQFNKINLLYLTNFNKIKIKKVRSHIFSVESYQDIYEENYGVRRIYGPIILFSISKNAELLWAKVFSRESTFDRSLGAEALWIDFDDYLYLIANQGYKGLSVFKINNENSNTQQLNKIEVEKFRIPFINSKRTNDLTEGHFFYLHNYNPAFFTAAYGVLSKHKSMPVFIKF
jgi:hypothetical protein